MYTMLPSQKNSLYAAFRNAGFNLANIELLVHDSGFRILLGKIEDQSLQISAEIQQRSSTPGDYRYLANYEIGATVHKHIRCFTFMALAQFIESVASAALAEIEADDLWRDGDRYREYVELRDSDSTPNTHFSEPERGAIERDFLELAGVLITSNDLNSLQIEVLHQKIDYLVDATSRLGRFDWTGLVTGTIFAYAFEAALSASAAMDVVVRFSEAAFELAYPILKQIP